MVRSAGVHEAHRVRLVERVDLRVGHELARDLLVVAGLELRPGLDPGIDPRLEVARGQHEERGREQVERFPADDQRHGGLPIRVRVGSVA